ncbi:MAG: hypothetical protein PHO56_00650 [Patescibacteria group bacterium]|nr:hypothetical protein [Patescibacteria group bacterium]
MKKILAIAVLFAVLGVSLLMNPSESKTKPYYSGAAVSYNGQLFIGSVNSGSFELFTLSDGKIVKEITIDSPAYENKQFLDLAFAKESGKLFAYLVNGRFIYKYDISNPLIPTVAMKIKDNSATWTSGIKIVDGRLVTISNRGARIWNDNYQIVDSYSQITEKNYGTASFSGNEIAIANEDTVSLFSIASRSKVAEYTIAVNDVRTKRDIVSDSDSNLVYVVDDQSLKAINSQGDVVKEFKHASNAGYDVANSAVNPNYLYFSDGLGIVKVDKETLKPVDWSWTVRTAPQGSWAMGMDVVSDASGDKIVVFNGSNIMVLNQNMKPIDYFMSVEKDTNPVEALTIGLDKNMAASGSQVAIHGTGFGLGETLKIEFNNIKVAEVQADANGRFETIITVPAISGPLSTDIKVTGLSSKLTYSTSFRIE